MAYINGKRIALSPRITIVQGEGAVEIPAVLYETQSLTDRQKSIARNNIEAEFVQCKTRTIDEETLASDPDDVCYPTVKAVVDYVEDKIANSGTGGGGGGISESRVNELIAEAIVGKEDKSNKILDLSGDLSNSELYPNAQVVSQALWELEERIWNTLPGMNFETITNKRATVDMEELESDDDNLYLSARATVTYVDGKIGDIETALDELHAYAQALASGGVE